MGCTETSSIIDNNVKKPKFKIILDSNPRKKYTFSRVHSFGTRFMIYVSSDNKYIKIILKPLQFLDKNQKKHQPEIMKEILKQFILEKYISNNVKYTIYNFPNYKELKLREIKDERTITIIAMKLLTFILSFHRTEKYLIRWDISSILINNQNDVIIFNYEKCRDCVNYFLNNPLAAYIFNEFMCRDNKLMDRLYFGSFIHFLLLGTYPVSGKAYKPSIMDVNNALNETSKKFLEKAFDQNEPFENLLQEPWFDSIGNLDPQTKVQLMNIGKEESFRNKLMNYLSNLPPESLKEIKEKLVEKDLDKTGFLSIEEIKNLCKIHQRNGEKFEQWSKMNYIEILDLSLALNNLIQKERLHSININGSDLTLEEFHSILLLLSSEFSDINTTKLLLKSLLGYDDLPKTFPLAICEYFLKIRNVWISEQNIKNIINL